MVTDPQKPATVDTVDQVSSVALLGLATVGALITVGAYWLLGS